MGGGSDRRWDTPPVSFADSPLSEGAEIYQLISGWGRMGRVSMIWFAMAMKRS